MMSFNPEAPRVLVVGDTSLSRKKMTQALAGIGMASKTSNTGQAVLERLAQGGLDLVLLDILMPGLSGFDVLEAVGREPALREIPILVMSSLDEGADVAKALDLGAADFSTRISTRRCSRPAFSARWRRSACEISSQATSAMWKA